MKGNSPYKFDNNFTQRCGFNERVTGKNHDDTLHHQ
jgi:hypothetical protein